MRSFSQDQYVNHPRGRIAPPPLKTQRLESLPDVALSSPQEGDVLAYDANTNKWENATGGGGGGGTLAALTDVGMATGGPTDGDLLKYDGVVNQWTNEPVVVTDLGDVAVDNSQGQPGGSLAAGMILKYSEVGQGTQPYNTWLASQLDSASGIALQDLYQVHTQMTPGNGEVLMWNNGSQYWSAHDIHGDMTTAIQDARDAIAAAPARSLSNSAPAYCCFLVFDGTAETYDMNTTTVTFVPWDTSHSLSMYDSNVFTMATNNLTGSAGSEIQIQTGEGGIFEISASITLRGNPASVNNNTAQMRLNPYLGIRKRMQASGGTEVWDWTGIAANSYIANRDADINNDGLDSPQNSNNENTYTIGPALISLAAGNRISIAGVYSEQGGHAREAYVYSSDGTGTVPIHHPHLMIKKLT